MSKRFLTYSNLTIKGENQNMIGYFNFIKVQKRNSNFLDVKIGSYTKCCKRICAFEVWIQKLPTRSSAWWWFCWKSVGILGDDDLLRGKVMGPWLWKTFLVLGFFLALCFCAAQGKDHPLQCTLVIMIICSSTWEQMLTEKSSMTSRNISFLF